MGHLELTEEGKRKHSRSILRLNRAARVRELNALPVEERLAMIHAAQGRDKYELLLDAVDGMQLLELLPVQDFFLLVKELGQADSQELLAMARAEQVAVCIDLDSWKGDELDGENSLDWLLASLGGDPESPLQRLLDFDFDLLVLILQRAVTVLRGPEELLDDGQEPGSGIIPYEFEVCDTERAKPLGPLLVSLFEQHQMFFYRLMEALRNELPTVLEEEVYQQRRQRLLDFGFPDTFEAMKVYARLDLDNFDLSVLARPEALPEPGPVAPGFALAEIASCSLLAEVLADGVDSGSVWDLSYLINQVMVADAVDVGDPLAVRDALERVYGYLNIGLEHLCGNSPEKAREIFTGTYLLGLFQLGHNLIARLQRKAQRLLASSIGPFLDGPYAALTGSLGGKIPRYCLAFDETTSAGDVLFSNLEQLRLTELRLADIETQRRLFEERFTFQLAAPQTIRQDDSLPGGTEQLTLSDLFLTALANRLLGRDFSPAPIACDEVPELHRLVTKNRRVSEELRKETLAWLDSIEQGSASFGNFCLSIWDEEFCGLDSAHLDPRHIGGLLIG